MFLINTLHYFSTTLLTLWYLVSHQEFHEFPESTLYAPTPQNGQTHSNNSSVFDHFVGLLLKGLRVSQ